MATVNMSVNPQIITIDLHNQDRTLSFDSMLLSDDFIGTVVIDNISAPVRFNTEGEVNASTSGTYTTTDTPFFDAKKQKDLHFYGASGTTFQARILYQ